MEQQKKTGTRRGFLAGLVAGAGAVAALATTPRKATATKDAAGDAGAPTGPILYRRTEEAERYYRTLYR